MKKQTKIILIIVIAVVILAAAAYLIYDNFFSDTIKTSEKNKKKSKYNVGEELNNPFIWDYSTKEYTGQLDGKTKIVDTYTKGVQLSAVTDYDEYENPILQVLYFDDIAVINNDGKKYYAIEA